MFFDLPSLIVIWTVLGFMLMAFGMFVGWMAAVALRGDRSGLAWDAALAPVGYLIAMFVADAPALRQHVQYADILPLNAAWILPVLHQIYRRWRLGPA
jgi:hypothetical protein